MEFIYAYVILLVLLYQIMFIDKAFLRDDLCVK